MTAGTPKPSALSKTSAILGSFLFVVGALLLVLLAGGNGPWFRLLMSWHVEAAWMYKLNVGIAVICAGFGALLMGIAKWSKPKEVVTSHGSARWADTQEVRDAGYKSSIGVVACMEDTAEMRAYDNPYGDGLSFEVTKPAPFLRIRSHHIWIEGPTGENKDQGVTYPTLLTDVGCPYVVYDPKSAQYKNTSGRRSLFGPVIRFAPGEKNTPRFNPLDRVRVNTEYEVQDAMRIANLLSGASAKEKDNSHYYALLGELLLTCSILHVLHHRTGKERSLAGIHALLFNGNRDRDDIIEELVEGRTENNKAKFGELKRMFEGKRGMAADDAFGTVAQALRFMSLPTVAEALSSSDFRPEDLSCSAHPTTIYLVVSFGEAAMLRPVVRLVLDQFLSHHEAVHIAGTKKHDRVCYLLNEFPALGRIPSVEASIAQLREYGVQLVLLGQSEAQLASPDAYGREGAQVILDNCKAQIFLGLAGREATQRLTEVLGKATLSQERKTKAVSKKPGTFFDTVTNTSGVGQNARELLTSDEVRTLSKSDCVVLLPGVRPYLGKRPLCYGIKKLQQLTELPEPKRPRRAA